MNFFPKIYETSKETLVIRPLKMSTSSEDPSELESEKIDVPNEMMQIIHKYTSWETMEDLDKAETQYSGEFYDLSKRFDINDLERELGRINELLSDLKDYDRDHCKKSLHDLVEIAKLQIVEKFPGIQDRDEYNGDYGYGDEYWAHMILKERTVNDVTYEDYWDDCGCRWLRPNKSLTTLAYGRTRYRACSSCPTPVVETNEDVEKRLNELYEELRTNSSKILEAKNLCTTSYEVCKRVESLRNSLGFAVNKCRREMKDERVYRERERARKEREEKEEEARKLTKEKFQHLCTVLKEKLGDRVENVVVSFEYCSSSCFLRDLGTGGKTMEIKANDSVIQDLQKRFDADNNDILVRNAALVLFNYAELIWKTRQQKQQNS